MFVLFDASLGDRMLQCLSAEMCDMLSACGDLSVSISVGECLCVWKSVLVAVLLIVHILSCVHRFYKNILDKDIRLTRIKSSA